VDKQLSPKVKSSGNGSVKSARGVDDLVRPDYESWEGVGEIPKSLLGRIVGIVAGRPILELAIIVAQIGLLILARDIIMARGGGLPPPQGFICIIALALMIWTPALYHPINLVVRNRNHAENRQRGKKATEFGDERGGSPEAGIPAGEDGRR
jgi:hypothetical protein